MKLESIKRKASKEMRKEMESLRVDYVRTAAAEIADAICPHLVRKSYVWRSGAMMVVIAYDEVRNTNNIFISDSDILISVESTRKLSAHVSSIDVRPVKDTFIDTKAKNKAMTNAMILLNENYEDILKSFFASLSNE